MSPKRTVWYKTQQTIEATPAEISRRLFEATQRMAENPNNHVAKRYFEEIGDVSRDVFLGDLVFELFSDNPPPP